MPSWLWIQNVVFPLIGMGLLGLGMYGVYRTVNRWLDRRHERQLSEGGGAPAQAVEGLRSRVEALEDLAYRVQELEERLDFTERVLAQSRDRARLGPGE